MNKKQITGIMRWIHLYTSLLLWPWMVIYALSGLFLNHYAWLKTNFASIDPNYKIVQELALASGESFGTEREQKAEAILARTRLAGARDIISDGNSIILRRAGGDYRITLEHDKDVITVKRKPFSFVNFANFLHFQRNHPSCPANVAFGLIVDFTTGSTLLWIFSGIYLWMLMPSKRLAGLSCIVAGILLFLILVLLCWR